MSNEALEAAYDEQEKKDKKRARKLLADLTHARDTKKPKPQLVVLIESLICEIRGEYGD